MAVDDDTWHGGYYEAALVLGMTEGSESDARLRRAIRTLCSHPSVRFSSDPNLDELDNLARIEGILDHPTLGQLPFGIVVVREREPLNGDDWLYAVVPLGGLSGRVPSVGGWPVGDYQGSKSWREPLEESLAALALAVADAVPMRLAVIGYEIAGIIPDFDPNGSRRVGFVARGDDGELAYWPTTDWYFNS